MPKTDLADKIHAKGYRTEGDSFRDWAGRFAGTFKDSDAHFEELYPAVHEQRILPAGRVQAAGGTSRRVTAANCFVMRTIPDNLTGIFDVCKEGALTMQMGGGTGYDFCLAPGTLITTRHEGCVPVEELNTGQEIIGFPEGLNLQKSVYEPSFVEENKPVMQPCVKIITDQGEVTASEDHMFVARTVDRPKKVGEGMRWIKAKDLAEGNLIGFTIQPWAENDLSDSWLAGIFDGEGWSTSTNVGIAQNAGPTCGRIRSELTQLSVSFREDQAEDTLVSMVVKGKWEAFRLLSLLKPTRLSFEMYGRRMCGKTSQPARVLSVSSVGMQSVWATRTTTRTLIANGFLSHNSTIRPRGASISTVQAPASGAVSFMDVYNSMCWTIMSAGSRRGAIMGCLRIDHPDIEEFIAAKQNRDRLTGFNVSVTVPHDFMRAEGFDAPWELKHEGRVFSSVSSRSLWEQVMRSAWDWSEPGVIFIDRVNEMNNLWYCEEIAATNPCAEQPLPPEGACILSSLNLTKYVRSPSAFDWDLLARDVATAIRMLDTVIERTHFPLHSQMHEAHSKRRVGLGVTGLANALEAMSAPYGSPMFLDFEERLLAFIRDRAYTESAVMAAEKGPFRLFDRDKYLDGRFIRTLPPAVRDLIAQNGIRNSHLLSIAPTGTISLCADNVSSGVEPVFSYRQERRIRWNDKQEVHLLNDYGLEEFGVYGKTMAECTVDDHLNVLSTAQRYVDSAVSKTVNTSPHIDWMGFKNIYRRAWEMGCKSLAVHKPEHNRDDVIRSCDVDPETGISTCEA